MGEIVALDDRRPKPLRGGNNKGTRRRFGNIRKLPSGRYQSTYLGPDGKRHNAPVTFQTKGDASAWLAMQSAAITERRWKPPAPDRTPVETFTEYSVRWLEGRELKSRTRAEYARLLNTLTEAFGPTVLDGITPADVRRWYAELDPKRPTRRAHLYSLLRTILGGAVTEELVPVNPCQLRGASKSKRVRKIEPATLDELRILTESLPDRWAMLATVAAWCALRFGELTELRRKDLDLVRGLVKIRRGVTWVDGEPVIGAPKSDAGVRDVTIPPHLVPQLEAHLAAFAEPTREGLVFPAAGGGHLNHGTFYKHFRAARTAAGRQDLRFHDLRHTGAVMAAQTGATTRELMDRLGHSTATMAMNYQHVADGRAVEIARRLSAMAEGSEQ